jgi:hypothetical protein
VQTFAQVCSVWKIVRSNLETSLQLLAGLVLGSIVWLSLLFDGHWMFRQGIPDLGDAKKKRRVVLVLVLVL